MNFSKTLRRGLSTTVVFTFFLSLVAACGGESTPAPTPTPGVSDLLTRTGESLAAMSTAKFSMVDETESGAKFFETTFKKLEAEVEAPDSFRMVVDVVAPAFGFVQIEMMAVGDQAYMKLSKGAPWLPLPLDQVPFNFAGLGTTLRDVLSMIRDGDATITGRESVMGAEAVRVEGTLMSEDLSNLITSVDAGHTVSLTFWIDESENLLRQIKIVGQIYNDDGPGTVRLLTIDGIDVPVDIQLPGTGSGQ